MKAAIPIPYIIALLFGLAVIALIGFYFFSSSSTFGPATLKLQCKSIAMKFCQEIKADPSLTWDSFLEQENMKQCKSIYPSLTAQDCLGESLPTIPGRI